MPYVRVLVCAAVLACAWIVAPSAAQADCPYGPSPRTLKDRARTADAVFVGTVTGGDGSRVTVQVSEVYKGHPQAKVIVSGGSSAVADSATFEQNTQYLFVADGSGSALTTSACLGSAPVGDDAVSAAEDAFGPPTSFRNPSAAPTSTDTPSPTPTSGSADSPGATGASSDSGSSSHPVAYGLIGVLILAGLAASFYLPRLRERRRDESEDADDS